MTAIIKPIEAKSVHQIQSGQVIVDLCSVVKELVENALDAEASSIEVRLKNYGLDAIEVQDNGIGIAEANYEGLALKHYTSKLSTFDDLSQLNTFGFRGEALSSLSALSTLTVVTAEAHEVPKGNRLEFEVSAAQKGTTVSVENLFSRLPVRQKELSKNIKREYGKVVGLLQAYACISTKVKFTIKNAMSKGHSSVVFSTKGNATIRENIANIYSAKMLSQLVELDLELDLPPTAVQPGSHVGSGTKVNVIGHISKPVFGEGRQTPDRQMFFVNGRPCGLPQFGKAINETYKSYNVSQSPFICADFRMDTNSYDVNVSPDKRTIFLHNASALTDRLKEELTKKFDDIEHTVPQSQLQNIKLPSFRQLTVSRASSKDEGASIPSFSRTSTMSLEPDGVARGPEDVRWGDQALEDVGASPGSLLRTHFQGITSTREEEPRMRKAPNPAKAQQAQKKQAERIAKPLREQRLVLNGVDEYDDVRELNVSRLTAEATDEEEEEEESVADVHVRDFNARILSQQAKNPEHSMIPSRTGTLQEERIQDVGVVRNAFDRMRPRRTSPELATITIGDRVITRMVGTPKSNVHSPTSRDDTIVSKPLSQFSQSLRKFNPSFKDDNEDAVGGTILDLQDENTELEDGDKSDERDPVENRYESVGTTLDRSSSTPLNRNTANVHPTEPQSVAQERTKNIEENAGRTQEEYRVAELIRLAESTSYVNSKEQHRRAAQAFKGSSKDMTTNLVATLDTDIDELRKQAIVLSNETRARKSLPWIASNDEHHNVGDEERLSLTISKSDFAKMHVAGQFNLGFIIALRHKNAHTHDNAARQKKDELFIIDQHASDEKYNFERLQAETVVSNQRLVHPVTLDLTAVEEEIVLENSAALQQNGFIIETDTSGDSQVGRRCQLLSLPLSKEVTFNTKDLEELIHLLSESHITADSRYVPRPSKVRKMFAMRACRSSIMIGKTLSMRQMRAVLEHMGRIDKPWNCPHGRPTMRHLISLNDLDGRMWEEGDGLVDEAEESARRTSDALMWQRYLA
ncbi:ATP-binding mismatch repair protein [Lithohypha guttulata]|uniref:DNA mismatch repair protein PMS1 n=1 Tax=Lithohypha guttulata TaxID=1690604 RepID=A0AAN7T097_9EURO|nr:ATP-binding mismatch repair protein [Lithohypha guttulata]